MGTLLFAIRSSASKTKSEISTLALEQASPGQNRTGWDAEIRLRRESCLQAPMAEA
jgi:hypothetical protein